MKHTPRLQIIIDHQGGLGNQLFQYAKAIQIFDSLSISPNISSSLLRLKNQSKDSRFTRRGFELDGYRITKKCSYLKSLLTLTTTSKRSKILFGIYSSLLTGFRKERIQVIDESDKEMGSLDDVSLLVLKGFWQNSSQLIPLRDRFKSLIKLEISTSEKYLELKDQVAREKTLLIHVRRGDYISNHRAASFHGALTVDYFKNCYRHIQKLIPIERTFVFTDDGNFVKDNFDFISNLTVVGEEELLSPAEILDLMRNGDAIITSNSSLSWWAAFLSESSARPVLSPSPWFRRETKPELYLEHWTLIDASFEN
jgi:hypothetical protein